MRRLKTCLLAAMVVMALGTAAVVMQSVSTRTVVAEEGPPGDHWRNYDGHWSYWHAGDNRWYYTDGIHWYFHDGARWVVYQFDKLFGRDFHHGNYKPPREVEVPKHGVFKR